MMNWMVILKMIRIREKSFKEMYLHIIVDWISIGEIGIGGKSRLYRDKSIRESESEQ
jgi:hypothetical protein